MEKDVEKKETADNQDANNQNEGQKDTGSIEDVASKILQSITSKMKESGNKKDVQSKKDTSDEVKNASGASDSAKGSTEEQLKSQLAQANALVEVLRAGVKPRYADDAVVLLLSKVNAGGCTFEEAMAEYKGKYPDFFGKEDVGGDKEAKESEENKEAKKKVVGTGSTPPNDDSGSDGGKTKISFGKRLAASRKAKNSSKSYWG